MSHESIMMKPDRWDGADCLQLSISNVLAFMGCTFSRTAWKQCGLIYEENQEGLGEIKGTYMSVEDELNWIHRIQLRRRTIENNKAFMDAVTHQFERNHPVIVSLNAYYLPFNMFYKKRHIHHTITLTGYDSDCDCFSLVDDAYMHQGEISKEELFIAMGAYFNHPTSSDTQRKLSTLSFGDACAPLNQTHYEEVIRINTAAIKGNIKTDGSKKAVPGLKAIERFMEDYPYERIGKEREKLFDIYKMLANVSNQHYLYAQFLKTSRDSKYEPVIEALQPLAQEWKICANMMLKAMAKNTESMYQRMMKKMSHIQDQERRLVNVSESMLKGVYQS